VDAPWSVWEFLQSELAGLQLQLKPVATRAKLAQPLN
jgi:hypothetical protein